REQEKAVAVLHDEEAIGRFLALVDTRQECMDRFDLLQQARAPAAGAGEPVSALQAEIQALFREAARIDAVNLEALRAQRELIREEIRKVQKGREAVRSYGHQGAGRPEDGAFVDKKN
ncbi:MAG: hypothetical protein IBX71_02980, partial [Candidatus Desulforudis sp.]|nr:hypothetical protein [Desulforudis sp.]